MNKIPKNRDFRKKSFFQLDDEYMNGYAKLCGWQATLAYNSLCRHANKDQYCFPSMKLMADENGVSRDTIIKGIKELEKWKIIKIHSKRTKKGTFRNNGYDLLDKSEWKSKPSRSQQHGLNSLSRSATATRPGRPQQHVYKDTHNKDTHILLRNTKREFGNADVNQIISFLKESLGLPKLDESNKINRQYAWHLLKKFNGVEKCKELIKLAAADSWYRNNITSVKELYYKGIKLIARKRGGGDNAIGFSKKYQAI